LISSSFSIPLPGKVQAENAALAITAIKTAFPQISVESIRSGLANVIIPGRFEKINAEPIGSKPTGSKPPIIIDGAHTPESLALCIETFISLYGEGGVLLFGCAADKDVKAMARIAHSHFSKIIITTPGNFKVSYPKKVYEAFVEIAGLEKTELIEDTLQAVKQAMLIAKNSHGDIEPRTEGSIVRENTENTEKKERDYSAPILGTGSFYLVSEIRKIVFLLNL
jgi:dihydrofolate synthase/folylpolyglutamate synthase